MTICVKNRHEVLGTIDVDVGAISNRPRMRLSEVGKIVKTEIAVLSQTYQNVVTDKFVIMPNHIHMIICILECGTSGDGQQNAAPTVSRMINQWKRSVSLQIGFSIWQKSFHDHIIRNQEDYNRIWQYIEENPAKWEQDCFHPNNAKFPQAQPIADGKM